VSGLSLAAGLAYAASAELSVPARELVAGQALPIELAVTDASTRSPPRIDVPDGLSVQYQGSAQERTMMNFQSSFTVRYRYLLAAARPGDYTVGPVEVDTDAGRIVAPAVQLRVAPRGEAGALDVLRAEIGAATAYVGQILVYHATLSVDEQPLNGRWTPPSALGLAVEPTAEPIASDYVVRDAKGATFVNELFYPMRATAPGAQSIRGAVLQAQYAVQRRGNRRGDFFRDFPGFADTRDENYMADALAVEVRPLPTEGKPPEFTGLVGSFEVHADPPSTSVGVGDTVTLDVRVQGDGSLAGIALPPLQGEAFRVYDDQPSATARLVDGRYRSTATFKRAIVPSRPGRVDIPPVVLAWFDPATGRYGSARTAVFTLDVTGDAGTASVESFATGTAGPATVKSLGEDILPTRVGATGSRRVSGWWAWLATLPGGALVLVELLGALRPRRMVTRKLTFADLPGDPAERLAMLGRIFRETAAERLGIAPDALTRESLAPLGKEAIDVFAQLQVAQFGGGGTLDEGRVRAVVDAWQA
jgi:hypothetical protein